MGYLFIIRRSNQYDKLAKIGLTILKAFGSHTKMTTNVVIVMRQFGSAQWEPTCTGPEVMNELALAALWLINDG